MRLFPEPTKEQLIEEIDQLRDFILGTHVDLGKEAYRAFREIEHWRLLRPRPSRLGEGHA